MTAIAKEELFKNKILAKILNKAALTSAKNSENTCPLILFDEPQMPASMIK